MGIINGCRHQHISFIGGIAEHQALISSPLLMAFAFVNAHRDIPGLLANGVEYCTGGAVETHVRAVVANVDYGLANGLFQVHIGRGGDLACYYTHAGLDHGLHRDARVFIALKEVVQDRI